MASELGKNELEKDSGVSQGAPVPGLSLLDLKTLEPKKTTVRLALPDGSSSGREVDLPENSQTARNYLAGKSAVVRLEIYNASKSALVKNGFAPKELTNYKGPIPVLEGTGFLVSRDGYLVTNHHISCLKGKVYAVKEDGRRVAVKPVFSDPKTDIAIMRLETIDGSLKPLKLGSSDEATIDQRLTTLGYSGGQKKLCAAPGYIKEVGLRKDICPDKMSHLSFKKMDPHIKVLETNSSTAPVGSGSPVLNDENEVVAVLFSGRKNVVEGKDTHFSFAVSVEAVKDALKHVRGRQVEVPLLAIGKEAEEDYVQDFPPRTQTARNYKKAKEAVVMLVTDGPGMLPVVNGQAESYRKVGQADALAPSATGVIIDKKGLVVTNYHVVKNNAHLIARMSDGKILATRTVYQYPEADLGFVQLVAEKGQKFKHLKPSLMTKAQPHEQVTIVGHPNGWPKTYCSPGTVTKIGSSDDIRKSVSKDGLEPKTYLPEVVYSDGHMEPGNSGSALLGKFGDLVGIGFAVKWKNAEDQKKQKPPVECYIVPIDAVIKARRRMEKERKTAEKTEK